MGLCSSVPRNANEDMKLKLSFGSKSEKLVIPPTSIKGQQQQQPQNGWSTARSTTTFTDHGSKEEAFFDSKAWLDSDCEDDFYSVNGVMTWMILVRGEALWLIICDDFTPSRGTTPVHHTFGTPSRNRIHGSMAETSPEKKKKLLELFRESVKDDQGDVHGHKEVKPTIQDVIMPKSAHCTPYLSEANSACSSERTMSMSEDRSSIREKSVKSLQWCIPSLSSCRSFRERRPKTSPAVEVNGKH
ncbi:hypothetical protein JHK82_052851 [Glycine max]|uniref:Uncharacterized protein n=1 Tax=Glycine soja TaxID=3848 RepID=A0A445FDH2_GLYSO|nr:hypothetical protein JHK85_053557 [Glycine max]KAG5082694.1 hypothetical protein JHK84_052732 [Glycine max]KAG5085454.1 hypothetical protein JHK82_052851 [Glycine max]RZB46863.1 hypothetical protein D0Y65_050772 [Glycine soja]